MTTSIKRRINQKFLGFLSRTFADILGIGSELTALKAQLTTREFNSYLTEEFRGSRYFAQTAIAVSDWFQNLSERTKNHILRAGSIRALTSWSLAALRLLPKLGENIVRSLLKAGAVTARKIREVAVSSLTKSQVPVSAVELEQQLAESWDQLKTLEDKLTGADSLTRETLRMEIDLANKRFARTAGKLGLSLAEALFKVKGVPVTPVITQEEIERKVQEAISFRKLQVEEALIHTRQQAEREVASINALKTQYYRENLQLKDQLQQLQQTVRERDLYKHRVEELERSLLTEIDQLKRQRDELAQRLDTLSQPSVAGRDTHRGQLDQTGGQQIASTPDSLPMTLSHDSGTSDSDIHDSGIPDSGTPGSGTPGSGTPDSDTISRSDWEKLQSRQHEAGLTPAELALVALDPFGYSLGREVLLSQLEDIWQRLEKFIDEKRIQKSQTPQQNLSLPATSGTTMTSVELRPYSIENCGSDSEGQAQADEVEALKSCNSRAFNIFEQLRLQASKFGFKLKDLVPDPFSVQIYSRDEQKLLAKASLTPVNKVLQAAQNFDGQLGRFLPVISIPELMQTLDKSQNDQLNLFSF